MLKITFLGTGTSQGIPVIACNCSVCQSTDYRDKRLRTSIMIESEGRVFVIDSGPDFRQQMLEENVKKIDAIILTHEHKDHIAGLDDIRAFNFFQKKPVDVYAEKRVHEAIKREYAYVFSDEKYPGTPRMNLHIIENKEFEINNVKFIPIRALHLNLPVFSFRIGYFTYITDANYFSDKEKEKIKGSKVIVINALRKKKHISHFNLEQALELLDELQPEQAYLTHISHQMGKYEEVQKELPAYVSLAYDGLKIIV